MGCSGLVIRICKCFPFFYFLFCSFPSFNVNWDVAALSCCWLITPFLHRQLRSYAQIVRLICCWRRLRKRRSWSSPETCRHRPLERRSPGKGQVIKYDVQSGRFRSTELGRLPSYYYMTYTSMMAYNQLRPTMSMVGLFRTFVLRSWSLRSCLRASRYPSRRVPKNLLLRLMYCCRRISRSSSSMVRPSF